MKRFLYIVAVFMVSLLLVVMMLLAALTSDKVETAAVQLVTAEFSRAMGTKAQIGDVEYRFPARLALHDIYIEDQQRDTLAYIGEVYAHFSPMALQHGQIRFSHVRLSDVVAHVYRLPDSTWNYTFLAEAFRSDAERSPFNSVLSVRDVQLARIRLRYESYEATLSHAALDLHHFSASSLDAQIQDLAMTVRRLPKSQYPVPLSVTSLRAHVMATDSLLSFPTLTADLPHSHLDLSGIRIDIPDSAKRKEILPSVAMMMNVSLTPADLVLFAPRLKGLNKAVSLKGSLQGTVDSLAFKDIAVRYNNRLILEGDVSAMGLPDLSNPYLRANLKDINTNAARLQDFLSHLYGRPFRLPAEVHRLGTIHYRGLAEGRLHDLTLHGAFRTALGTITTDGTFRSDSLFNHMDYDARVVGRRLQLGRLVDHAPLETATLDVRSKGKIDAGEVNGDIIANINQLTYDGYTYDDIRINGHYQPRHYNGSFEVHDPHLDASFNGVVDVQDRNPEINFSLRCNHFDTKPLHLAPLKTSFALTVDMSGASADKMSGYLVLDSLAVATVRDSILMSQLTLLVNAGDNQQKTMTMRSDYITVDADGQFRYADLFPSAQALLHRYLPSVIESPKPGWQPVRLALKAEGQRLRDIQRLFEAPVVLSDHPTFTASLDGSQVDMRFSAPGVRFRNTPIHDVSVSLTSQDSLPHSPLMLEVSAEAFQMHTLLTAEAFADTIMTHLTVRQQSDMENALPEGWQEMSPSELYDALDDDLTTHERFKILVAAQRAGTYGGDLQLITHFSRYNRKPLIDLHFLPGTVLLRDSVYTLDDSRITWCASDTSIMIEHFRFEGAGQHIAAHGIASARATDTIAVDLKRIDASYVVPFLLPVQTIMFDGLLTGEASVAGAFRKPDVKAQIHVDSMGLNHCHFGDADVALFVDDSLHFHADVYKDGQFKPNGDPVNLVTLDGKALFTGNTPWVLDMMADSVPLAFVNHWTSTVLNDLQGYASGHVVVGGWKEYTYVLLRAEAQEGSFTLPWTGVRYTIPHDTIVMDTTAILFPHVYAEDEDGNPVYVDGGIYHEMFQNFVLDLHVDVQNALAFDLPDKEGEMLQGRVYATGHVDVTGNETDILVAADARTTARSRFRLSLDNTSSAYESNFIHFVDSSSSRNPAKGKRPILLEEETDLDNIDNPNYAAEEGDGNALPEYEAISRCLLTLNLDVNPYLLFQLVLGERNGDMIQGVGNGAIRLTYDTQTGDVRLLGTYVIDQGTLSYTVANMIRREFTIGEGSTIVFSGDATNPQLDVSAKYRVTANLHDLFGEEASQLATSRSNIPVLTCLHMTGTLNAPILRFSLEFPNSDPSIQQQVQQIINTDEMLMRQVIYLLVFGRFFTPDYMTNTGYNTINSTYSLLSSTLTGQLNAWLSKLTNMVTLGVAIRTDEAEGGTSQEYEAQFQIQPVDRLVINGNVGYRYNDISNQPFFGDLDVELLLTDDGQFRLKGYTHTVDKYSLRQAATIQGVGFVWKKDFNWPTPKKKKAKSKK